VAHTGLILVFVAAGGYLTGAVAKIAYKKHMSKTNPVEMSRPENSQNRLFDKSHQPH